MALTSAGAVAPAEEKRGTRETAGARRPQAYRDSIEEWRQAYIRSMEDRLRDIDRRLDRMVEDSLAKYRSDSLQFRKVLEKARTDRDKVDNIMDDLAAVRGEIPSDSWEAARSELELSLDSLEKAFLAADSARQAGEGERKVDRPRHGGA